MEVCGSANINPLLIDDVVETVFSYLKLGDLKRSRLVCHIWCRNATKVLHAKSKPSLLFGDGKKQFESFLKLAQSSLYPLPHRKITLQSSILSLNRSKSLETFFSSTCTFLHSLYITYQDGSHQITVNKNSNSLTPYGGDFSNYSFPTFELPLLKHLHYEELPSANGYEYDCKSSGRALKGHILFDKLLRACVNLERLDLILQDTDISKTEPHFLSLVNCSKTFGTLRALRTLMLKLSLSNYHFELLGKAGLVQVANVQLRFQNEQCSTLGMMRFLEGCAPSLKTLSTNIWMRGFSDRKLSSEDLVLPCLPKLENLELSQWRSFLEHETNLPFSFNYKSSFPHLRKLTLQSHSWEKCWNEFFPLKEVCHTLQELKLPKLLENKGLIPKIAKTFPELKKLDVTVIPSSVNILTDVFCFLCGLEELSVNFYSGSSRNGGGDGYRTSMCIDYVMTGLPEAICKRIYAEDKIQHVKVDLLETGYSLANLKYLKTLQLKNLSSVNYGIPQFTDITGYLAVMQLKRLKTLYIWRSQMSNECITELDKKFKLNLHPNF